MNFSFLSVVASAALIAMGSASAAEFKFTTPMPPGVLAPDTIETRLGTLKMFGGFPDQDSVQKLYDNLDF